ncbi:hypothetical protein FOZ60_011939 [Perkinsus olseni]|uniref:Uncharacterized protein n=1 Tax=Perkinsus olseni TaxID=32597 RepID=A0A7J6NCF1_PEROL|nr:hypothetical protein FOZ60_011939 [Perkinsus olseni]
MQLLFYILGCSVMEVIASNANPIHFYKEVKFPWDKREAPVCSNSTLCPKPNYTWQFYFDQLLAMGVKNYVFGGYAIKQNSEIELDWAPFARPWDKKEFESVRRRVKKRGGKILADLGYHLPDTFDRPAFLHSARAFAKRFAVDGFRLGLSFRATDEHNSDERNPQGYEEVGHGDRTKAEILLILSSSKSPFRFSTDEWQIMKKEGLGAVADTYFGFPWPSCNESKPPFNSIPFAEEVITNAIQAGVHPSMFVFEIPLFVPTGVCDVQDYGYSSAVYDDGADPRGNGSILYSDGRPLNPPEYFFSQPRAVEKVDLADEWGLNGIMLKGGGGWTEDLYPWDKDSLLHALAKKFRKGNHHPTMYHIHNRPPAGVFVAN